MIYVTPWINVPPIAFTFLCHVSGLSCIQKCSGYDSDVPAAITQAAFGLKLTFIYLWPSGFSMYPVPGLRRKVPVTA